MSYEEVVRELSAIFVSHLRFVCGKDGCVDAAEQARGRQTCNRRNRSCREQSAHLSLVCGKHGARRGRGIAP